MPRSSHGVRQIALVFSRWTALAEPKDLAWQHGFRRAGQSPRAVQSFELGVSGPPSKHSHPAAPLKMSGSATHHHDHHHNHAESPSLLGGHDHDYSRAGRRSLIAAQELLLVHMVADIIGGVLSGSLSLLAHAGHMVTDAGALVVALAALHYAQLPASTERTFGLRRLEVLAALFNVILLWTVAGTILLQVFEVVGHGHAHGNENLGTYLLAIGALGIVIHLTSAFILHRSQHHSVSVEGAFRHVSVHAVESVAIIVSGILVSLFHWHFLDWALSLVLVLVILFSTYRLVVKIIKVLLQAVPDDVDVYRLCNALEDVPGVTFIHDVHVWALVPRYNVLTAHAIVDPDSTAEDLMRIRTGMLKTAREEYGIRHTTFQLEFSAADCHEENHHVDHLMALSREEARGR